MGLETGEGPSFEHYDEAKIQELFSQGWEMDADGLDEDEAYEMTQMMTNEHRVFIKEDGLCTILIKQMGAYEELSQSEYGQNPQDLRNEMHREYNDIVPEVMEDNDQNR